MLPEIGLAKGACTLWEEGLLFDYTIEVEDKQFSVHKAIMASVSDYFKVMLTGGIVESRKDKVRLEGLSSLAVKNMIEYIYTGKFGSSTASAEELLICAVYLQIPAAVKLCTVSLCEEVNKENCFHILSIFKTHAINDGIEHTIKFIKQNFEDILYNCKTEDLSYEELLGLMDCWRKAEWQLFVRAMEWLKKDYQHRKEHLNEIMSHMRFCLMSPSEIALIASTKGMGVFTDIDNPWHDLVQKALRYHTLPTHQKVLEQSEQSKVRSEPSPVCFGTHLSVSGQLFSIHGENLWTCYDVANPFLFTDDESKGLEFTFIEINNFFIVCMNSGNHDVQCSIFNPRSVSWSAMASMTIPREQCDLVYHENHLYALGGRDRRDGESNAPVDVIEKYDFHTNTWSVIPSKLPVSMVDCDAFSINGLILVVSAKYALHSFDPQAGKWVEKAVSVDRTGTNMVCVEIDREKVIAYIDDHLKLHYYKPSVDQWLEYDRSVPSRAQLGESGHGALIATGNTLYLVDYALAQGVEEGEEADADPVLCEKWTFDENGLTIDTIIDHHPSGMCTVHITSFCALLALP